MFYIEVLAQAAPPEVDGQLANVLMWLLGLAITAILGLATAYMKREISYRAEHKELHDDNKQQSEAVIIALTKATETISRFEAEIKRLKDNG